MSAVEERALGRFLGVGCPRDLWDRIGPELKNWYLDRAEWELEMEEAMA